MQSVAHDVYSEWWRLDYVSGCDISCFWDLSRRRSYGIMESCGYGGGWLVFGVKVSGDKRLVYYSFYPFRG